MGGELRLAIHTLNQDDVIYVICFEKKLKHAKHYIGFCEDGNLQSRFARHTSGRGAKILRACNSAGIKYKIVRVMKGDRNFERKLKRRKNAKHLCPICNPSLNIEPYVQTD